LKALRLERIDLASQTAKLALDLGVGSDQGSNIAFDALRYDIALGGARVASGETSKSGIGDRSVLTNPIDQNLVQLGSGVASAVRSKGSLDVAFDAGIQVATPFGTVPLDIDRSRKLRLQ